MVCPICGGGKDFPINITCDECLGKMKCEYCGDGYQMINIGKLLGKGDKWGCNSCADKYLKLK